MTIPRQRFKTIGTSIDKITKPIFGERGFGQSSVITDWPQIVGATLAQHTVPEKISFPRDERRNATLQLKIDSSALALELQHFSAQLVEKVNTYFGYKAVGKIQIVQGPVPEKPTSELTPLEAPKDTNELLDERLVLISDPELKAALSALASQLSKKGST